MAVVVDSVVPVPGGSVFVRCWSRPAGRAPIFLFHDSLGSVELWRDFPAALARATDRSVVAYDRLGFGKSTRREGLPGKDFIRDEAEVCFPALVRALDAADFAVFGHSVGGAMALAAAASHPSTCKAVITEAAQAFVEPRTLEGIRAAKESFRSPEQFAKLTRFHGDKAQWVLDAWTEVWLSAGFSRWSLDPLLREVRCPVLAIHGSLDEFGSEAFPRRIAEGVRGRSRFEILADCGHVPHRERCDEVLRLTAEFLGQAEAG